MNDGTGSRVAARFAQFVTLFVTLFVFFVFLFFLFFCFFVFLLLHCRYESWKMVSAGKNNEKQGGG
jgi:hypothetical protein